MCGRIQQKYTPFDYQERIDWNPRTLFVDVARPKYNVAPGAKPIVFHRAGDGEQHTECVFLGYEPAWGKTGPASNARLDKLLDNAPFWRGTLKRRMLVPADGWFEWTGDKPNKQPWFIQASDGQPIYFAAVSGWEAGVMTDDHTGFAIVTDAAHAELLEIHKRRPIALAPEDALAWLDPKTTTDQAKEILMAARPESDFEWWRVTKRMGDSRYQEADASQPITQGNS